MNGKGKRSLTRFCLGSAVVALGLAVACTPYINQIAPNEGVPGDIVSIQGGRFGDTAAANTVTFKNGAGPADVLSASTTEVEVRVPAGAQTGLVKVTTSKGTGASPKNFIVPSATAASWTFMVYVNGDNNLEGAAIDDYLEMATVGSSSDINIVVQMDRRPGYSSQFGNWTDTRRFLVAPSSNPGQTPVQNLGEQNMGDPNVLRSFVVWAIDNYPADRYALVIWDHGDGWRTTREDLAARARSSADPTNQVVRAVSNDDTDSDVLFMREVQDALQSAKVEIDQRTGSDVKLDLVGFDACLMGMIEVGYALRNVANFVVGSEDLEPYDGWPYDDILAALDASPGQGPDELAGVIVNRYVASGGETQSAVQIDQITNVVLRLSEFTNAATSEWPQIRAARNATTQFHPAWSSSCWGADLWDFADEVESRVTSPTLKTAAQNLKDAIDDFVIHEDHTASMTDCHGTAIYFPPDHTTFLADPDHTGYEQANAFMEVDFVKYVGWDNWLANQYYPNNP